MSILDQSIITKRELNNLLSEMEDLEKKITYHANIVNTLDRGTHIEKTLEDLRNELEDLQEENSLSSELIKDLLNEFDDEIFDRDTAVERTTDWIDDQLGSRHHTLKDFIDEDKLNEHLHASFDFEDLDGCTHEFWYGRN